MVKRIKKRREADGGYLLCNLQLMQVKKIMTEIDHFQQHLENLQKHLGFYHIKQFLNISD